MAYVMRLIFALGKRSRFGGSVRWRRLRLMRPGFGTKLIKGTLPPRPRPPCLLRSLLDYNPKYASQIYGGTSLLFLAHRKLEDFVRFIETGEQETPDPDATPEGEGHDEL